MYLVSLVLGLLEFTLKNDWNGPLPWCFPDFSVHCCLNNWSRFRPSHDLPSRNLLHSLVPSSWMSTSLVYFRWLDVGVFEPFLLNGVNNSVLRKPEVNQKDIYWRGEETEEGWQRDLNEKHTFFGCPLPETVSPSLRVKDQRPAQDIRRKTPKTS